MAEKILKQQIKAANSARLNQFRRSQYIHINLNKYFRQYIGFVNEAGRHIVYVNLQLDRFTIFDRMNGYWDSRLDYDSDYSVSFDGGHYYWRVYIDLNKKLLYDLSVNGLA